METATKKYTIEAKELLYSQLKGSRYTTEIRDVLRENGHEYDPGYIRLLLCNPKMAHNEAVWDAVFEVVKQRKNGTIAQKTRMIEIQELVNS